VNILINILQIIFQYTAGFTVFYAEIIQHIEKKKKTGFLNFFYFVD